MEYEDGEGLLLSGVRNPAIPATQERCGHLDRECALSRGCGPRFNTHQARVRKPAQCCRGRKMTRMTGLMFALLGLIAASAAAQTTYPDKPIRMVVGFP